MSIKKTNKTKKCTKCQKFDCVKGLRFCSYCKNVIEKRMAASGYLENRHLTKHLYSVASTTIRSNDCKENTKETKGGPRDAVCHKDDFSTTQKASRSREE